MPRYALKLEYDGAPFAGWQRQADQPSVQGAIEAAATRLIREQDILVQGAGRTDAGVHARGQVAHLDLRRVWDPFRLMEALNAHLRPAPVAVVAVALVDETFHARFSANMRRYLYRLTSRRAHLVLEAGRSWQVRHGLDVQAMQRGADYLVGHHDFTTFRSSICQAKSPVKTLDALEVRSVEEEIHLHVQARSFLHNQVRSFAGTLERVGAGAWPPSRVAEALAAKDRAACGPVAPPQGLYLIEVGYPNPINWITGTPNT
jgi:tRNA pseudouridine38-40 synthase